MGARYEHDLAVDLHMAGFDIQLGFAARAVLLFRQTLG
jgi:hypothetical protein